jgi:putative acetyltransferase
VTDGLVIRPDDPTAPHVADLLAFHLAEMRGAADPAFAFALDASGLSSSAVTFWTAWQGETLAGFAALRQLALDHGEVKSMRAAPGARRTGIGRALLRHVIAEAHVRHYRRLSLETGTGPVFAPAAALYRSAGFVDCPPFADYQPSPHNRFMTLQL